MKTITLISLLLISLNTLAITKNVMAPLLVSDFGKFQSELHQIKSLGADAVSTDIWWGKVEKSDQQFDWSYYQKLSDTIIKAGLKWVPIFSFHQCGGNVGDTCNIPIPSWIWSKYQHLDIKYKSEQGNQSSEVISVFATPFVISEYTEFFKSFSANFKHKMSSIQEINISLGPAGELRYPSYNSHDQGSGYPTRGSLQAYSELAKSSFRDYVINKYKSMDSVNSAWGFSLNSPLKIHPPTPNLFFKKAEYSSNYGLDFYEWYSLSLREHGRLILQNAISIFRKYNTLIGAKIPGIHWRMAPGGDRLAEANAGLIDMRSGSWNKQNGYGYNNLISLFQEVKEQTHYDSLIIHFTCLEKDNWEEGNHAMSWAQSLVFWISEVASSKGIEIKGENALAGPMQSSRAWDNIQNAISWANYSGITILRIGDVLRSDLSRTRFSKLK